MLTLVSDRNCGPSWMTWISLTILHLHVQYLAYLGTYISRSGGTEEDIRARPGKARAGYNKLGRIWNNSQFNSKTKIKIFKSNVLSVLLYACETCRMDEKKLDVFLHKSLRGILKMYWPTRITNQEIRIWAGITPKSKQLARRRWTQPGHVLRMDHHLHLQIALTWVPEGRIVFESRDLWPKKIQAFFHARSA